VPPYPQTRRYVIQVLRRYDPDAARAAVRRIYGQPQRVATPAPAALPTRLVSVDWPPPPSRPSVLGRWAERLFRTEPPTVHGTDSP
jgi:hypothetical protein